MAIAQYSTKDTAQYVVISSVRPAKKGEFTLASFLYDEMKAGRFKQEHYELIGVISWNGDYDDSLPNREYNQFPTYDVDFTDGGREGFLKDLREAEERFHVQHPGRS